MLHNFTPIWASEVLHKLVGPREHDAACTPAHRYAPGCTETISGV
jgi:hypothetical protein